VFRADLRGHYGFIMVHRDNMSHLVKGHPMMVELSISKPTFGKSQWEQVYNFPELGVSFLYAGLENKKQLGPVYAIFPYINFKLNQSDFCNFRLRIGSGIGYFPVTFDVLNNHKNLAISSHLNGAVNFLFLNRIRLTNKMSLENGIAFTHFSNGAYKMPNLGINIVTVNSGLSLLIGDATKTPTKGLLLPHSKSLDYGIIGTVGIKALEAEGKKYPVYTFRTFIDKSISYKSSVGAGLDLGYNTSIIDRLVYDNIIVTKKTSIIQPGVNLAYTVKINNLSLFINKGIYLNRIDVRSGIFYHRLGIRYKFNNRLIANVSLKTHFGIADHFEYGLGYKFNK
ncbi:MAG: acyloxyacyl hydrolase, partial [Bacteroidota bacterium]|nr:acyloxyacyl hydrolase [Bacteroidota bacterium]